MKAIWKDTVIAESDNTIVIEGNHYFPRSDVQMNMLEAVPDFTTTCPWKGVATYFDVLVDGDRNAQAAWTYEQPKEGAIDIAGDDFTQHIAFWHGVEVTE